LKLKAEAIEALVKVRKNTNRSAFGLTDDILVSLKGSKTGIPYQDVVKQIDDFAKNFDPKNIKGFNKILSDLKRGDGWTDGAEFTLRHLNKNATNFKSKKLVFEQFDKWNDIEKKVIRIADLVDETNLQKIIYFEFKSVKGVPPGKFNEQFIKDLSRTDVTSLDQLKWVFDAKKSPIGLDNKTFRESIENAVDGLNFNNSLAQKYGKTSSQELKDLIITNFDKIFDVK